MLLYTVENRCTTHSITRPTHRTELFKEQIFRSRKSMFRPTGFSVIRPLFGNQKIYLVHSKLCYLLIITAWHLNSASGIFRSRARPAFLRHCRFRLFKRPRLLLINEKGVENCQTRSPGDCYQRWCKIMMIRIYDYSMFFFEPPGSL